MTQKTIRPVVIEYKMIKGWVVQARMLDGWLRFWFPNTKGFVALDSISGIGSVWLRIRPETTRKFAWRMRLNGAVYGLICDCKVTV